MDDLLLDACVALNLLASGIDLGVFARACDVRFLMTSVAASETLWLDPLEPGGAREEVDIASLAAKGTIDLVTLDEDESEVFVSLARDIDDGEAATIAVASHRGLAVATDDRRARQVAAERNPPVRLVRTTELVKRWADQPGTDAQEAADVIRSIEIRASYVPARNEALLTYQWVP